MTVSKDGSLGSWGGTKYEGLGSRDVQYLIYRNSVTIGDSRVETTIFLLYMIKKNDKSFSIINPISSIQGYMNFHILNSEYHRNHLLFGASSLCK